MFYERSRQTEGPVRRSRQDEGSICVLFICLGVGTLWEVTKLYAYSFGYGFKYFSRSCQGEGITIHILAFLDL